MDQKDLGSFLKGYAVVDDVESGLLVIPLKFDTLESIDNIHHATACAFASCQVYDSIRDLQTRRGKHETTIAPTNTFSGQRRSVG